MKSAGLLDRVASAGLTIAALAVAVSVVHREFAAPVPSRPTARAPAFVANWKDLLSVGIPIGDTAAPIKVVEFADFECPFCRRADSVYHEFQKEHGAGAELVFVHFPLSMHRFALPAARAADCAMAQGRFARMHDLLYTKQDSLGLKSWTGFASDAGVKDTVAFSACVRQSKIPLDVQLGLSAGKRFDVDGTPTVIVNGWRFAVPPTVAELDSLVTAMHGASRE